MQYKKNLFDIIKLLFLAVIVAELGTIKMIMMPESFYEYIQILFSIGTYIEHIVLSIVFLSLGALIFLRKA